MTALGAQPEALLETYNRALALEPAMAKAVYNRACIEPAITAPDLDTGDKLAEFRRALALDPQVGAPLPSSYLLPHPLRVCRVCAADAP